MAGLNSWSPALLVSVSFWYVIVARCALGSSGSSAAAICPRVATKVSRAASEDRIATLMRHSKPSGSKTGCTVLPMAAAQELSIV